MKNIQKNIGIVLITLLVLISCDSAIDIIQPGELNEDAAFRTVEDLQLGLNNEYFGLNTNEAILISSLFTDETSLGIENGGQNLTLLQFLFNPNTAIPSNLWLNNYQTINRVNRILAASSNITISNEERDDLNDILGQLYAMRAAEYFELLTYYSTDLTDDNALGVMLSVEVPDVDTELPRVTNGEVFAQIESDLALAKNFLDPVRSSSVFITQDFVTALEARIALYRGNNSLALSKSQELIDGFQLADRGQYEAIFRDVESTGVIFKGERTPADAARIAENFYFRNPGIDGGPYMELGRALFNQLDPNDIRFDVLVNDETVADPDYQTNDGLNDILLIGKYEGSEGQPTLNDYKYFRVAEMYLIKAEAQARLNDLSGAAETLKELRDARFADSTEQDEYGDVNEALTAVLNERRIELAFEGHRYIDLKRFNSDLGLQLDRDPVDCEKFNACTLPANEFFKFTFPIPQIELSGNSVIRDQQNPGY